MTTARPSNNSSLEEENKILRSALEFYASRTVYELLNQFPGDRAISECQDVAERALEQANKLKIQRETSE